MAIIKTIREKALDLLGRRYTGAVILAGGSGTRMGAGETKQMRMLCGKPLIVHTLLSFEACEAIDEIVLVAKKDELPLYEEFKETYGIKKLVRTVAGGKTRQESAKCGFDALSDKTDYVAIHDGARALITPEQITQVVMAAYAHGAAIAAHPSVDTVKYAENGKVGETLPRENIWLAQTPQVFRDEIYRTAAYIALRDGFVGTDDASLVEHIGKNVYLCDIGSENLKVTYKSDLALAGAILREREKTNADRTGI